MGFCFVVNNYSIDVDSYLLDFCHEFNNLEVCQRISNFTNMIISKDLSQDLLFLDSPQKSFVYQKEEERLERIDTLISKTGSSTMKVFFRNNLAIAFQNDFVYQGPVLPIPVDEKRKFWKKLLQAIPLSKFSQLEKRNGFTKYVLTCNYKKAHLEIIVQIASYLSKHARISIILK